MTIININVYIKVYFLRQLLISVNVFFSNFLFYFSTIKEQVISTYTNLARWLGWWREGVVCVGGNRSTLRKPTWSSR